MNTPRIFWAGAKVGQEAMSERFSLTTTINVDTTLNIATVTISSRIMK